MNTNDRIGLYESVIDTFLSRAKEGGHIVLQVHDCADEYVQYAMHGGAVYGEVGSRQWAEPERPVPPAGVDGLRRLGFVGGGPERNFAKDELPRSASELAQLTEKLMRTAYDLDDDYSPVMSSLNLQDITLPRAEPFTRDMIASHLRDNDIRFLRDEEDDIRVDLTGPDGDIATVWFFAEGEGDAIYRITNCAHRGSATRQEALERCNAWNRDHRWPKAFVLDFDDTWRIVLSADIDLGPGVPRPLFDTFTKRVASGMAEFWGELAESDGAPGTTRGGDDLAGPGESIG